MLQEMARLDIELDQKLYQAFTAAMYHKLPLDSHVFRYLVSLNSIAAKYLHKCDYLLELRADFIKPSSELLCEDNLYRLQQFCPDGYMLMVLEKALKIRSDPNTLSSNDFILAVIQLCIEFGEEWGQRPHTLDFLALCFDRSENTPISKIPEAQELIYDLKSVSKRQDDFNYILVLEGDRLSFRVTTFLDDFLQEQNGIIIPQRAILTHFQKDFGFFTLDQIKELEELINSINATENDFQNFFERYSHFFRKWDCREVYPHTYLSMKEGHLIPDFILTNRELQKATILELKLPKPKIIRRQKNRDRFADAIMEARSQLLRYRDWFREESNRKSLIDKVGMEIYEPHMGVIIGQASEFEDDFDRQRLQSDNPDIEVVTYDEILKYAKRRLLIIK